MKYVKGCVERYACHQVFWSGRWRPMLLIIEGPGPTDDSTLCSLINEDFSREKKLIDNTDIIPCEPCDIEELYGTPTDLFDPSLQNSCPKEN